MRRLSTVFAVVAAGAAATAALAGASSAAGGSATVVIRHQLAHCHAWSVNGSSFRAAQTLTVNKGTTVTFVDNDIMPHKLVQLAGTTVTMRNGKTTMPMGMHSHGPTGPGAMGFMGASTRITLTRPGFYRFGTRPGEDYMAGVKTTGADNVLTLKVTVR